jgi:hypothetical protein
MSAARYFDLLREMKDGYNHRLRLVESARERGIKPTARLFATTAPTVRALECATSARMEQGRNSRFELNGSAFECAIGLFGRQFALLPG